jgi:hypothetical protein
MSASTIESSATTKEAQLIVGTIEIVPSLLALESGTRGSFSAVVSGVFYPIYYQWYKDGYSISSATGQTLSFENADYSLAGNYTVSVSTGVGSPVSTAAVLRVSTVTSAPTISIQPLSQTIEAGQVATLSVVGSDTSSTSYQWFKGTRGESSGLISGATTASFITPALNSTTSYWVRVTNSAGSVDSGNAIVTVNRLIPSLTWAPSAVTFGAALSAAQLNATASVPGSFTYSPPSGTVVSAGAQTLSVTFTSADTTNYAGASASVTLTVTKAAATVALGNLNATYDGSAKAASATTTPAGLTVDFTYDGSATAPISAASYAVVGKISSTNYQGSASGALVIAKAAQTITFGTLAAKTYGDAAYTLGGTASSSQAVTYASSNPAVATVSGNTVTIVAAGTTTITASQAGTSNYNAATSVSQVLTVTKAAATVALGNLSATYDGSAKAASATTTPAGLTVDFTYDGSATMPISAASYAVVGTIASTNYQGSASGTLVIAKAAQTITFDALAPKNYGAGTFSLVATATSRLTVSYASSNPAVATVSGSTVTIVGVGTTTITASQAGTSNYNAASNVTQTLTVVDAQATQAVLGAGYIAGGTVTLTQTLTYTGSCSGLGWQILLPSGWSYAGGGGSAVDVKPAVGTTNLLEWAWTTVPASPLTLTVTLNVPASETGDRNLTGLAVFRVSAGEAVSLLLKPDPLVVSQVTTHSADADRNFRISIGELTRVIQLYNTRNGTTRTGWYGVATATTEDGFNPEPTLELGATVTLTRYHAADSDHNGKMSLLELTRVIELYNTRAGTDRTGAYHAQAGTEDGFALGP